MTDHNPAIHCVRCAFRLATRHLGLDRVCDRCVTPDEWKEIDLMPVWQKEDE